jgi:hypothetical protein
MSLKEHAVNVGFTHKRRAASPQSAPRSMSGSNYCGPPCGVGPGSPSPGPWGCDWNPRLDTSFHSPPQFGKALPPSPALGSGFHPDGKWGGEGR